MSDPTRAERRAVALQLREDYERRFGEVRPADVGHDQGAWAKNRRDEFVLLHPK